MRQDAVPVKKEKMNKILRRLFLALFGLILGINAYLANANRMMGNKLPMPFGYGAAVVLSDSMQPALSVNDLLIIHETADYTVGDIVVYQDESSLIVHRIVKDNGETVITRGDANNTDDAPIHKSSIKGIVVRRIPSLGALVNALKTPVGILLVLLCAILLIELSFHKEKETGEEQIEAIKDEIRQLKKEQEHNSK